MSDEQIIVVAADAAGMSMDDFVAKVTGLLSAKQCRDTKARLFSPNVLAAINSAQRVSRHLKREIKR